MTKIHNSLNTSAVNSPSFTTKLQNKINSTMQKLNQAIAKLNKVVRETQKTLESVTSKPVNSRPMTSEEKVEFDKTMKAAFGPGSVFDNAFKNKNAMSKQKKVPAKKNIQPKTMQNQSSQTTTTSHATVTVNGVTRPMTSEEKVELDNTMKAAFGPGSAFYNNP